MSSSGNSIPSLFSLGSMLSGAAPLVENQISFSSSEALVFNPPEGGTGLPKLSHRSQMQGRSFAKKSDAQKSASSEAEQNTPASYQSGQYTPTQPNVCSSQNNRKSAVKTADAHEKTDSDRILESLSVEQRQQAMEEIEQILSPELIEFLKSRRQKGAASADKKTEAAPSSSPSSSTKPPADDVSQTQPADVSSSANAQPTVMPRTYEELIDYLKSIPEEREKIVWMLDENEAPDPQLEKEKEDGEMASDILAWRFDFTGEIVFNPSAASSSSNAASSGAQADSALYHHAKPNVPGYSLEDLFTLAHSSIPSQRVVALSTLAAICRKAIANSYPSDVWALLINHKITLIARKSVDATNVSVIDAGMGLILATLIPQTADQYANMMLLDRMRFLIQANSPSKQQNRQSAAVPLFRSAVNVVQFYASHDEDALEALMETEALVDVLLESKSSEAMMVIQTLCSRNAEIAERMVEEYNVLDVLQQAVVVNDTMTFVDNSQQSPMSVASRTSSSSSSADALALAAASLDVWTAIVRSGIGHASWQPMFSALSFLAMHPRTDSHVFALLDASISQCRAEEDDVKLLAQLEPYIQANLSRMEAWTVAATFMHVVRTQGVEELQALVRRWPITSTLHTFVYNHSSSQTEADISMPSLHILSFGRLLTESLHFHHDILDDKTTAFLQRHARSSPEVAGFLITNHPHLLDTLQTYMFFFVKYSTSISRAVLDNVILAPGVLTNVFSAELAQACDPLVDFVRHAVSDARLLAPKDNFWVAEPIAERCTGERLLHAWLSYLASVCRLYPSALAPGVLLRLVMKFYLLTDALFRAAKFVPLLQELQSSLVAKLPQIASSVQTDVDELLLQDFVAHFVSVSFGDETFANFVCMFLHSDFPPAYRRMVLREAVGCHQFLQPRSVFLPQSSTVDLQVLYDEVHVVLQRLVSAQRSPQIYDYLVQELAFAISHGFADAGVLHELCSHGTRPLLQDIFQRCESLADKSSDAVEEFRQMAKL
jgi:hypothetical protein